MLGDKGLECGNLAQRGEALILGNFLGAILIVALPVVLNWIPGVFGVTVESAVLQHINTMIIGALIIFFLIAEPLGLAQLWGITREKLILWPFPH